MTPLNMSEASDQTPGLQVTRRFLTGALAGLGVLGTTEAYASNPARLALLVGVSNYNNATHLPNALGDAGLIADTLRPLGFDVATVLDPTRSELVAALAAFSRKAQGADAAVVYFAGHGVEIANVNYLLPRDVSDRGSRLTSSALEASSFREAVRHAQSVRLVVLDACRNTPDGLKASDIKIGLGRETGGSTAEVVTLMAAAPGQAALDGDGDHSPFAQALADALKRPGLTAGELPRIVQVDVQRNTGNQQVPDQQGIWTDIYWTFDGKGRATAEARVLERGRREQAFWQAIRNSDEPGDFRAYIEASDRGDFTGLYRPIAVNRMAAVERKMKVKATPAMTTLGGRASKAFQRGDYRAALAAWKELAAAGSSSAMYNIGVMYFAGRGVDADQAEAVRWFASAARAQNGGGMVNYGLCLLNGYGIAANPPEAALWIRRAAEGGLPSGMGLLGQLYLQGAGLVRDERLGASWLQKAADAGDGPSMTELGALYEAGEGVKPDKRRALELYRRAADAGEGQGMVLMGYLHEEGEVLPRDLLQAATWYQRAAEAGDAEGMAALAVMLENGTGLAQDYRRAAHYYKLSADLNHARGLLGLGNLYATGKGVRQNFATAAGYFQKAADLGSAPALRNLAVLYETGRGVPRDQTRAAELYEAAAKLGDKGAATELIRLRGPAKSKS